MTEILSSPLFLIIDKKKIPLQILKSDTKTALLFLWLITKEKSINIDGRKSASR